MASASRAVVTETTHSPHCRLRPVPVSAVRLRGGLWAQRQALNREVLLPEQYRLMEETGRLDNFRRAAGHPKGPFQGRYYNDSDVYKWLEAASWSLASEATPELQAMTEQVIELILAAQSDDGYINTYFSVDRRAERWSNLRDMHELYCAGHLIQAAIAHRRACCQDVLYDAALQLARHICKRFGEGEACEKRATSGHPEIELALVELWRESGQREILRQAELFVDRRGRGYIGGSPYHQDHMPLREMERLAGHAVRALYLNAGAADLYAESGDPGLLHALERMWRTMVARQLYLTGAVGSRHQGEAFGDDYELPGERSYAETCAAIASIMWNWRMLQIGGEARYADLIERTMYNAVLCGLSADGRHYFYDNPHASAGQHRRVPWFECSCCPPNVARFLASLSGLFYSTSGDEIWVHHYGDCDAAIDLSVGCVEIEQRSDYPWDGAIRIEVRSSGRFALMLRVPSWAAQMRCDIAGEVFAGEAGSYLRVERDWAAGDIVEIEIPLAARWVEGHPYSEAIAGRAALVRGPIVYCVQGSDNPGLDPRELRVGAAIEEEAGQGHYVGMTVLCAEMPVRPLPAAFSEQLFRPLSGAEGEQLSVRVCAVPYLAWGRKGPTAMQIWHRLGGC